MKLLRIKIRVTQNAGEVWISRNKHILAPFGAISGKIFHGPENIKKRNPQIQIRSAQNVGKVWISRKNNSWPHLGPFQANVSMGQKNAKTFTFFAYFPWWANGLLLVEDDLRQETLVPTQEVCQLDKASLVSMPTASNRLPL